MDFGPPFFPPFVLGTHCQVPLEPAIVEAAGVVEEFHGELRIDGWDGIAMGSDVACGPHNCNYWATLAKTLPVTWFPHLLEFRFDTFPSPPPVEEPFY